MTSLISQLRDAIRIHADRVAIQGSGWILEYQDLDAEVERLAAHLRAFGVASGDVVPLLMGRSPRFVIALLAVLRCGAAYAPIDTASPPARRAQIVRALRSPVVLADCEVEVGVSVGRKVIDVAAALAHRLEFDAQAWPDTPGDAPLYVMFTSGSSGSPKGVIVPHSGVQRLVMGADYASFRQDARWAQLSSVAFDASTLEIWGALLHGARCVIQEEPMPSLDALADFLVDQAITDAWLTASLFNSVVDERIDALAGLRQLLTGGERLSPRHVQRCLEAHPRLRLINGYGPSENTTFSLCHTIMPADVGNGAGIPIGSPIAGTKMAIVDANDREVATGDVGELLVGGLGVARGYLNDPELTARRFFVRDDGRWYRTGDRVRQRADGLVEFLGRADRQVKIQGHRIELDEIESVLGACPGVGLAAVRVDGETSENRHLVAFYAGAGQPAPDPADVIPWLEQQLPPQMVPRVLRAVPKLPLTLSGKVDHQALRAWPSAAAPRPEVGADGGLPSATAGVLREIWQACLPGAQVDARSHFTAIGGTSILALRVAAEVRRRLGRELAPIDVLRVPVLKDQARLVEASMPVRGSLDGPPAADGAVRLSRAQSTLLYASRLDASGCAMLVHVALLLPPTIDLAGLQRAFEHLAERHPVLRTAVRTDDERVDVRLNEALPSGWWRLQSGLDAVPAGSDWPEHVLQVLNRPLDTSAAPMRVDVWTDRDGNRLLVWTVHHFAIDDFSIGLALADLDAPLRGMDQTPVYGSAFAFAALEQAWTDVEQVERDAWTFARALTRHAAPLPPAPRRGREVPLDLPPALSRLLFERAAQWSCTPVTPLIVACGLALQATFGASWRFVLTPFSRRLEPELMESIGYFLDLRLVEAGARKGEALAQTIRRVHGHLLAAQRPTIVSADRVAEALDAIDPALRTSLFQFGLTWREDPERDCRLGSAEARLLRVPQRGARFGLCLHLAASGGRLAASLEAVEEAWAGDGVERFGAAFDAALHRVLALDDVGLLRAGDGAVRATDEQLPAPARQFDPRVQAEVARIWAEILGRPPAEPEANFLADGGSSILAMRLTATLRRRCGLVFDLGAFLARPTLSALCHSVYRPSQTATRPSLLVGPHAHRGYVLLIPGRTGMALGLYPIAEAIRRCMPADTAVILVDLRAILDGVPPTGVRAHIRAQLLQVARDRGVDDLQAVAGHSVGGLFGADLLQALDTETPRPVPLILLDTFAPRILRSDGPYRMKRHLVALATHPWQTVNYWMVKRRSGGREPSAQGLPTASSDAVRWKVITREMLESPMPWHCVHAILLQARRSRFRAGLLRHRATNGFDPSAFASFDVVPLDTEHREIRGRDALMTARVIAELIRAGGGG